jgi:aspartate-semialdehyde dehydrogenase
MEKIPVAILGATGTVGQKFVTLLVNHPYFEIRELVASERSAGKAYEEVCSWRQNEFVPDAIRSMTVKSTDDPLESMILFSGLDSSVAGPLEERYAKAGHVVISNSKNHRMDDDVPIIIPEVNHAHFELAKSQPYAGAIITNSNCSTMFVAMVLAPIYESFGIEAVQVTTMQAVTGAGYPGVSSIDIMGNVIPYIAGEEEKLESEPQKILGKLENGRIVPASFPISAQCNRVGVFDGHTETLSIKLKEKATPEDVARRLDAYRGYPQERRLPSAPAKPILVFREPDRPQPARDVWKSKGMAACVGRIRRCSVLDLKMVILGHNTVRGAAGAAILNGEAYVDLGYLSK